MTQSLYAHMNKGNFKKLLKAKSGGDMTQTPEFKKTNVSV
jgi:hypothetical protein